MIRDEVSPAASSRLSIGQRIDRYAVPTLSVVGMAISGYLTYIKLAGGEALCVGVGGCEVVQSSAYAQMLGIPVALLGFLGTLALFAVSMLRLRVGVDDPNVTLAGFGLALFSILFCAYLSYIELFVLHAI